MPLAQGQLFFYWDNAKQHYAQTKFLHDSLRAGSLPQWWPAAGMGFPVTAEGQAAHYSPLRVLLALVLNPSAAMMWEIGIYLCLAGIGTYLFLREIRASRPASALGAVAQMLGSFSVIFVRNMALHRAMSLLPLAMVFAERFVRRRRARDVLSAALILGLQFLTGHPTFAVVTAVASTCYVGVRILQQTWRAEKPFSAVFARLTRTLLIWCAVAVLGFGIAAVQTVPMLTHVKESLRAGGLTFDYAVRRSLSATPRGLGMALLPYAYTQGDWIAEPTSPERDVNGVASSGIYAGSLPVVLAALAVLWCRRRSEPVAALTLCGVISAAFALGVRTPLFPMLWSLPGLNGMRYPHRFLLWTSLCLSGLAAIGFDKVRLYSRSRTRGARMSRWPMGAAAGLVAALCAVAWMALPEMRGGIQLSIGLLVVAFGLIALHVRASGRLALVVATVAMMFVAGDLLYFRSRGQYATLVPESTALSPPRAVQYLKTQPGEFRVMSLVPLEGGWTRNQELRELVQPDLCTIWGIDSFDFYASLPLKRAFAVHESIVEELRRRPESAAGLAGFLGAMNVGYVIGPPDLDVRGWGRVFETSGGTVWKNPQLLPRFFLVGETRAESTAIVPQWEAAARARLERYAAMTRDWASRSLDAQILDRILDEPVDFHTVAVVSPAVAIPQTHLDSAATVVRRPAGPDSMIFEVNTARPALLYLAESYYPGWRVRVNDAEGAIVRANWLAMGVPVPAGFSRVVLTYDTPGYRIGLMLTVFSVTALALAWFLLRRTNL